MQVKLEEGHIWFDADQWGRNAEKLNVGKGVTLTTSNFHPESGTEVSVADFRVCAGEEKRLQLKGEVVSVCPVVERGTPSGENRTPQAEQRSDAGKHTENRNLSERLLGYDVTLRDIRIQPIDPAEKEEFNILIQDFEVGWMDFAFHWGGITHFYLASYIGNMPLYSLLDAVAWLDSAGDEKERTYNTLWSGEPGSLKWIFKRKVPTDSLAIELRINGSDRDENAEGFSGTIKVWHFLLPYLQFRKEVVRVALCALNRYGLKGMSENWMDPDQNFPLVQLIGLLQPESDDGEEQSVVQTDIRQELQVLIDALNAIRMEQDRGR